MPCTLSLGFVSRHDRRVRLTQSLFATPRPHSSPLILQVNVFTAVVVRGPEARRVLVRRIPSRRPCPACPAPGANRGVLDGGMMAILALAKLAGLMLSSSLDPLNAGCSPPSLSAAASIIDEWHGAVVS